MCSYAPLSGSFQTLTRNVSTENPTPPTQSQTQNESGEAEPSQQPYRQSEAEQLQPTNSLVNEITNENEHFFKLLNFRAICYAVSL